MKRITSILLLPIAGSCTFTSYSECNLIMEPDAPEQPQQPQKISQWMLPTERYGITLNEVAQTGKERDNKVEHSNELMTLTATPQDTKAVREIIYYFGKGSHYQVTRVQFVSQESAKQFIDEYLLNNGLVKSGLRTAKASEEVYISAPHGSRVSSVVLVDGEQTEPIFWWANSDNKKTNQLRIDPLQDKTIGIWTPLLPYGVILEMVQPPEARMGHTFDAEASKPDKGVFKFRTGHEIYTEVTYQLDLKTNHFPEESKIPYDTLYRPTPEQLDAYLRSQGFKPTGLKDEEGNPIYYDKSIRLIANADMNIPKDIKAKETFRPGVQYYTNSQIEQLLPYEGVDLPMPLFGFEKDKLENVTKKYAKEDYTATALPMFVNDTPFPGVQTRSKYFSTIILLPADKDENLYGAVMVICTDLKTFRSPSLTDRLERRGFAYDRKRSISLSTYINEQEDVMAQTDEGIIITGLSLSPTEDSGSSSASLARRLKRQCQTERYNIDNNSTGGLTMQ